jgi:hypothetical protein
MEIIFELQYLNVYSRHKGSRYKTNIHCTLKNLFMSFHAREITLDTFQLALFPIKFRFFSFTSYEAFNPSTCFIHSTLFIVAEEKKTEIRIIFQQLLCLTLSFVALDLELLILGLHNLLTKSYREETRNFSDTKFLLCFTCFRKTGAKFVEMMIKSCLQNERVQCRS